MSCPAAVLRAWLGAAVAVLAVGGMSAAVAQQPAPAPAPAPAQADAPARPADATSAVASRFARWDTLRDRDFRFDPDQRAVLGYSVRTSPVSRAALDAAEKALAAGDMESAARQLTDLIARHGDDVVQVAGNPGRWVGVGEWALYLLLAQVPPERRAGVAGPDVAASIAEALAWRDMPKLRSIGWTFEGLPEGAAATAAASRLLAERGARDAAAAAASRALQAGPDTALASWAERHAPPPAAAPPELELPERLKSRWRRDFGVARLGDNNPFAQWPTSGEAPIAPIVPIVSDGVIYVADSVSISAWELLSGRLLWHHAGPLEVVARGGAAGRWFSFGRYVDDWRKRAVSPYQVSKPAIDGELVVGCVQAVEASRELHTFDNIPINWPLPVRHLVALDRVTGRRLWSQTRPLGAAGPAGLDDALDGAVDGDDFLARFSVAAPPTISGGSVYAAGVITQGAINSYVAAFDAGTGELQWKTFLCAGQQDLTMFNRPFQEHTASPALVADGAVFVSSNLGIIACLDSWSGRVRWLAGYTSTARVASHTPERDQRRDIPWINRVPQLEGGLLIVAPLDSRQILALDPATGRIAYTLDGSAPRPGDLRHEVLGTGDGRLLLAGEQRVECVDAASGKLLWTAGLDLSRDDRIIGALELSGNILLVPTFLKGLGAVDLNSPMHATWRPWEESAARQGVRRAVAAGPALLLTDNTSLWVSVDEDKLLAAALAAEQPEDLLSAAELLLSLQRLDEAEERFEALLASDDPARVARARTGRLETGLRRAKLEDTPARWEELLALGQRIGDPWSTAPIALVALHELQAEAALRKWMLTLADIDPAHRLDLGALTPAGALPAGLLAAQLALPDDTPAAAIARLQDMLQRWPDERWNGGRVADEAAHGIAELLATHGRALYADYERQAEQALLLTDDASSLQAVEQRFPNALAVSRARAVQLRQRLEDGHAREVFEMLAGSAAGAQDGELAELRVQAARALGEDAFVRRLLGEGPAARLPALPALPAAPCVRTQLDVTARGTVSFPGARLVLDEPFASSVVCAINGPGELLLLDTVSGQARWRRPLPGRASYMSPGAVTTDGSRLFLQVSPGRVNGVLPQDLVEAVSLTDGSSLWTQELPGEDWGSVVVGGLILRLHRDSGVDGGQQFRLSGWGCATGVRALAIDLPPCESAHLYATGSSAVVFMAGELRDGSSRDVHLAVVDLVRGTLGPGISPPGESPVVLESLDDPPRLLLTTRTDDGTVDSVLSAFDPNTASVSWTSAPLGWLLPRQKLFVGGPDRVVLLSDAPSVTPGVPRTSRLTPVDALLGVLPATDAGLPLTALPGQVPGRAPLLVTSVVGDSARLVVADGSTASLLYSVRLPGPPGGNSKVVHGRDGFVLITDRSSGMPAALRVFDGATGTERYSTAIDELVASSRPDVTLVNGAVLLASGGRVTLIRSPTQ